MLPRIHLGSIIKATESQLTKESRQQKQAVLEARVDRNLEGFYVYQTYLRRLRRMHRAYVARYKRSHPGTRTVPPPPRTSQFYSSQYNDEGGLTPMRHRLALSDHACRSPRVSFGDHENQRSVPTPPSTPSSCRSPVLSDPNAIHIPCGREHSSNSLFSQRSTNSSLNSKWSNKDTQRLQNSTSTRSSSQRGALPFRLWRQKQGKAGTTSIYSYETIKEEDAAMFPSLTPKNAQKTGTHSFVSIKNI